MAALQTSWGRRSHLGHQGFPTLCILKGFLHSLGTMKRSYFRPVAAAITESSKLSELIAKTLDAGLKAKNLYKARHDTKSRQITRCDFHIWFCS